jgi:hypothetical protein
MAFQIIRVKKLTTTTQISGSAAHVFRQRDTRNADPEKAHLNQFYGADNREDLQTLLAERLVGVKKDKQAVRLVEYMVTASPEFFDQASADTVQSYFKKTMDWFREKHGEDCILGWAVHMDEKSPHMHIYVTPIAQVAAKTRKRSVNCAKDEEHPTGRKIIEVFESAHERLSAKSFFDNNKEKIELLSEMQTDFFEKVGKNFGLERGIKGSTASHQSVKRFYGQLEPKIEAAEKLISEAQRIKKEQEKTEEELEKKRLDNKIIEAEIAKKVTDFNAKALEFRAEKSAFQEQKAKIVKAIGQVFDMLPSAIQLKLADVFGVVLEPDTKQPAEKALKPASGAAAQAVSTLQQAQQPEGPKKATHDDPRSPQSIKKNKLR